MSDSTAGTNYTTNNLNDREHTTAPAESAARPILSEAESEADFAEFTRSLGIEPEDW